MFEPWDKIESELSEPENLQAAGAASRNLFGPPFQSLG